MFKVSGEIEGVADILFHRFTEKAHGDVDGGITGGTRTKASALKEAETYVYKNGHGLFLPKANIKKALAEGASKGNLKEGKKGLAALILATVFFDEDLPFGMDTFDFIHECSGRRPPRTGGRCVIRRPALRVGWKLPFSMTVTDDRRNPESLRLAMEQAGLLAGLCDWRPEHGRFIVTRWEATKA